MATVIVVGLLLGLDQLVESSARDFVQKVNSNPADLIPRDDQPSWFGEPVVDSVSFTTTITDRIFFRRRIVVKYTKTIAGSQFSFSVVQCAATYRVDHFTARQIDHKETPSFTFY
jgi:hypothetical protein